MANNKSTPVLSTPDIVLALEKGMIAQPEARVIFLAQIAGVPLSDIFSDFIKGITEPPAEETPQEGLSLVERP